MIDTNFQNLKIAVCFSGQIRTALRTYKSIKTFFGDLQNNIDIFAHTWFSDTRNLIIDEEYTGYRSSYVLRTVPESEIQALNDLYKFKSFCIDNYEEIIKDPNMQNHTWAGLLTSWKKSVDLVNEYSNIHRIKYDVVIKLRFDLAFNNNFKLTTLLERVTKTDPPYFLTSSVVNSRPDDIIILADQQTMTLVSSETMSLVDTLFPNDIINDILTRYSIVPHSFGISSDIFCILRNECQYDPAVDFNKCLEFWKIYYQSFSWKDLSNIKSLTNDDIKKDAEMMIEKFGHIPYIVKKFYETNCT